MFLPDDALRKGERRSLGLTNQRCAVRYKCALATAGRIYADGKQEFQRGWVLDLSQSGAGFLLGRPLPIGKEAVLQMRSQTSHQRYELPARVVHATKQIDGEWLIGFEFVKPLSDNTLEELL